MGTVRRQPRGPGGTVKRLSHVSKVLEGNPWNDPCERELCVYLPPGYSESSDPGTVLWDLAAFTNSGPGHLNWRGQGENLVHRLDRLIVDGKLPPVVVAIPDCYSSLGGNQYLNSGAVGPYADYLVEELLPLVSAQFNVIDGPSGRGVFGKSSGAYGALFLAMHYPGLWGGVAAHAADCGFDLVYRPEFPTACAVLAEYKGDVAAFLEAFWNKRLPGKADYMTLMVVAMAASYDPDPDHPERIRLPFDLHTCQLHGERWANWLRHDPVQMVEGHAGALQGLNFLWIDAGRRDQFNIQYGTRALSARLEELDIRHHFEEFDGTHSGLDWRLDESLPAMVRALQKAQ